MKRKLMQLFLAGAVPAVLMAFSSGPPLKRTGAAVDGGLNCSACHRGTAVNSGPGKVTIEASSYYPGRMHTIRVKVEDTTAQRWGFQLTARLKSDETKTAGVFLPGPDIRVRCDPDGRDVPAGSNTGCGGALEFVEHTRPGTAAGTTGSHTFEVQWLAPGNSAGDVVFYAAGNAANNNNANTGDHIYTTELQISSEGCEDRPSDPPTITQVSDAAGGTPAISTEQMISIYGGPFAANDNDKYGTKRGDLREGKVPTELACVAVEVAGKRVPVFYVQRNQINAQAPIMFGSGPVDVKVIINPSEDSTKRVESNTFQVNQQTYSPALFTFDGKTVAALDATNNYSIVANPSVVPTGVPAKPGDILVLYGTGFGFTEPIYQPGEFSEGIVPTKGHVTVTIGGVTLSDDQVLYAGLSSEAPGFYQFNIRLPESVADGDVPIKMSVGGFDTQAGTTIPIQR